MISIVKRIIFMFRVLVADDNKDFLDIIATMLSKVGYDVVTAGDGIEAIDRFNGSCFDAIVTDLAMPRANGYELARHIRDTKSDASPAVICITGSAWDIDRSCFDIVMEKPISIKKLIDCLRNFENRRK
jgi:CheY-like chemotaxis protein